MSRFLSTISAACLALIVCAPAAVRSQARGQTDVESAASLRGGRHSVLRDNVVLRWNAALLQAVRNVRFAPPFTARALAITHTCMYDAWAAYTPRALGTRFGDALRRPRREWTQANQQVAVSFAAYRALVDLFPSQTTLFDAEMAVLGLDPARRPRLLLDIGVSSPSTSRAAIVTISTRM